MPSLLVAVFVLQLTIHIINVIGVSTLADTLWNLYNRFPTPTSAAARKHPILRREILSQRKELAGISSQDEFARWARLKRKHDKSVEEEEKLRAFLLTARTTFDRIVTVVRWLSTNGLRFFLQFWYSKVPIFWVPAGWLPWYAEWVLSFPRAPMGSVSIQVWGAACLCVISLAGEVVGAVYGLWSRAGPKAQMPSSQARALGADYGSSERRKEL